MTVKAGGKQRLRASIWFKTWEDASHLDMVSSGGVCVLKKDGSLFDSGVDMLIKALGWDGAKVIDLENYVGAEIQVSTKEETYKEETAFKVNGLYPADAVPNVIDVSQDIQMQIQARAERILAERGGATPPPAQESKPLPDAVPADDIPY